MPIIKVAVFQGGAAVWENRTGSVGFTIGGRLYKARVWGINGSEPLDFYVPNGVCLKRRWRGSSRYP